MKNYLFGTVRPTKMQLKKPVYYYGYVIAIDRAGFWNFEL